MGDILFLAHRVPFPPDRGDKIRSFNILQKLRELATVHVACFADDGEDMAHGDALRSMLGSLHIEERTTSRTAGAIKALASGKPVSLTMFDSKTIRAFVKATLAERDIDTVFVFSGQMAQFVPDLGADTRFIMDFGDVDSAKFAAYAETTGFPMNLVHRREAATLSRFENTVAHKADATLFVSDAEAALFQEETGAPNILTLENGIDCDTFDPDSFAAELAKPRPDISREGPLLVFTGQMDYRPNIEAVRSFAEEVLPQIREQRPDARFAIVGRAPTAEVRKLEQREGVIVTGGVPDIRSWLAVADVVVAPLRMARGIQNKVLEAMAMARPVVASRPAYEGIDAETGRDIFVAESPAEEAQAVLALLAEPERAAALGKAARQRMLERYSWESTLAPLAEIVGRGGEAELAEAAE